MRFKFTIFLLGLNVLTFGLIGYLSHKSDPLDSSEGNLSAQIGREIIEADKIELSGSGLDQKRVLKRTGSNWQISEPMQWKANYFAINRILNQLQFIEEEATFSIDEISNTGQSLADYGLEDPLINLTISEGEESLQLSIGTLTEIGNNVYLLGPDRERIFVVNREVIDGLLVDLSDLRNREIFDIPVFEVTELSLQIKSSAESNNGDLKVRLANTTGEWRFEAPLSAEADPALVSNTINTLASLKVGRFIEPEASDPILHGLENPFMRVTLHGNKRRQTLLIGNLDPSTPSDGTPQFFARLEDNPIAFTVDARPFENLLQAQESLRERNFMSFDQADLNGIYINENGREIRLQKIETGDWQVLESAGGGQIQPRRADPEVMDELIEDLQQLRAKAFAIDVPNTVDLERLGFNAPRRTVTLQFDTAQPVILELAHPEDENEKLYARTAAKESIYEVERRPTLQLVPLNALHYRNRNIETLPQAAIIKSVRLTNLDTNEPVLNYEIDGQEDWAGFIDTLNIEEADALSTLLGSIRAFDVKSYLADGYADAYQLDAEKSLPWAYRLTAEVILPGGETQQTREVEYVFTERLSGTMQVGGSKANNAIFELKLELIEALYVLTENMPQPPESRGEVVPEATTPAPVPEPEAPQAPTN
ncbi:hypothetical protein DDZ13_04355 [Coraliomargarita sinensis]|uniref:DUF4340 domain-containing protein n=1 Tax=Coraliomargarita sinensis TaxID=2174842 RepID=A0A317ZMY7_9BACT|nr:DUF4340 domain-containing protein [Coraliomargarita sinensis]PXA05199.1 hypothetical protein DDZ13_04355 [Coraliomargarita sinensis]